MLMVYWFILIAALMPYVVLAPAKMGRYDNARPRDGHAQLQGLAKRAYGAHLNSFEAFPLYAAAVIIAVQAGMQGWLLDVLAGSWLVSRVIYIYAYLKDMPTVRSGIWAVGVLLCVLILSLPFWGPWTGYLPLPH